MPGKLVLSCPQQPRYMLFNDTFKLRSYEGLDVKFKNSRKGHTKERDGKKKKYYCERAVISKQKFNRMNWIGAINLGGKRVNLRP